MPKYAKDPKAPKRPATAYFMFAGDYRPKFLKENPEMRALVAQVGKAIGGAWADLSTSERETYQKKANTKMAAWKKKNEVYKNTSGYKKWLEGRNEWKKEQKKFDFKKRLKSMLKHEPKRPTTAFFLFSAECREEWADDEIPFTQMAKKAAGLWGKMSDGQKAKYTKTYEKQKAKYVKEMNAYHKTAEYKRYLSAKAEAEAEAKAAKKQAKKAATKAVKTVVAKK